MDESQAQAVRQEPQRGGPGQRPIPPGGLAPPPYGTDRAELERLCDIEPTRGSGPGGQRRNKVETGVRLTHPPSGVVVVATRRASRQANLEEAFERLARRLEALNHVPKRRRPTRPSKAAKESRLETKKRQSERKSARRLPPE
jgi:ribosome-associated protein